MAESVSHDELIRLQAAHPLDNPQVIGVITKFVPEYLDQLPALTKPRLSVNPDDLELWEANGILTRRQRKGFVDHLKMHYCFLLYILYIMILPKGI